MEPNRTTDQAGTGGGGASRRRPLLASLTTLGVVTGLLGVAGVFAAGSDRATTGENDVISGELGLPGEDVDLQLASASFDPSTGVLTCGDDWSDDLTTGVVTSGGQVIDGQYPGIDQFDEGYLCVRNVGDGAADLSVTALDVVDTELDCSNGEAAVDESCGSGAGELSSDLVTGMQTGASSCIEILGGTATVAELGGGGSRSLGVLQPQQELGLCPLAFWSAQPASQSDQVTWRFAFDGALSNGETCIDDEFEENDTAAQAAGEMYLGDTYAAVSCGDGDWFRVGDGSEDEATFRLSHDPSLGDLDLYLYDAEGNTLASSEGTSGIESIQAVPLEVFTIEVRHYEGGGAIPYELSLTSGEALTPLP